MKNKYVKLVEQQIKISYCAIVLTEKSREKLLQEVTPLFKEVIAHHMTINMGSLSEEDKGSLGKKVRLKVVSMASDSNIQAVGVKQLERPFTKNTQPHITISLDRSKGAKPFHSNRLSNWESISQFEVEGIVEEL